MAATPPSFSCLPPCCEPRAYLVHTRVLTAHMVMFHVLYGACVCGPGRPWATRTAKEMRMSGKGVGMVPAYGVAQATQELFATCQVRDSRLV